MSVRQRDGLQGQPVPLEPRHDGWRVVAGVNANGPTSFSASDQARVLLKGGDGNLFDYHAISGQHGGAPLCALAFKLFLQLALDVIQRARKFGCVL